MTGRIQHRLAQPSQVLCLGMSLVAGLSAPQSHGQGPVASAPASIAVPALTPQTYVPKAPEVQGVALDRVVAIVDGSVILDSDVNEEMRFDALDLDAKPLGPPKVAQETASRSVVLERLINRELVLQQIKLEPPADIDTDAVNEQIAELRKSIPACAHFDCKTDAGWKDYLASIDITDAAFRNRFQQRLQVLAFTERRFRMGIRITPEQERVYYDLTLLPKYRAAGAKPPPFASISARIEQVMIEQQVSALLTDWLHSLRAQGSVIVLHPGEEAP